MHAVIGTGQVRRKRRANPLAWQSISGHILLEHARLAATDPNSPRVKPTLPALTLLRHSVESADDEVTP
jgi:hypothetical protein